VRLGCLPRSNSTLVARWPIGKGETQPAQVRECAFDLAGTGEGFPRLAAAERRSESITAVGVGRYDIELEPEVREWLQTLTLTEYSKVEAMADHAETLGEPYSRHLSGKTRELRFHLTRSAVRISYWLAPGARVVLLTVFRKTRQVERAEVDRAVAAQKECASGHEAHAPAIDVYERKWISGWGKR
jgi:hypothetical protein